MGANWFILDGHFNEELFLSRFICCGLQQCNIGLLKLLLICVSCFKPSV
uniref:Uncharacterized protein n=1 Tax=Anguilla anguilla TaxID=7936 RepID=A0A0E9WLJ6_ANGAN